MIRCFKFKGAALLSALFVTAIAVAITAYVVTSFQMFIRGTQLVKQSDQLYQYLQGVNDWAQTVMLRTNNITRIKPFQATLPDASLRGEIKPQNGLFNLNCLGYFEYDDLFRRLLKLVLPNYSSAQTTLLIVAIRDWVTMSGNFFDTGYSHAKPPYRAAHRPMLALSELRQISGINDTSYQALKPYVTALPANQCKMSVLGMPSVLWRVMDPALSTMQADTLVNCTKTGSFNTIEEFMQRCGRELPNSILSHLTLQPDFFLVSAEGKMGDQKLFLYTLFKKSSNAQGAFILPLWQQINADD